MALIFKSIYFWIILILAVLVAIKILNPSLIFPSNEFCGESTFGECETNADCMEGGCSGEDCKGKTERAVTTDCVWKGCYNEDNYDLSCQCVENQCQWK